MVAPKVANVVATGGNADDYGTQGCKPDGVTLQMLVVMLTMAALMLAHLWLARLRLLATVLMIADSKTAGCCW